MDSSSSSFGGAERHRDQGGATATPFAGETLRDGLGGDLQPDQFERERALTEPTRREVLLESPDTL
jgi:hypothetical protein